MGSVRDDELSTYTLFDQRGIFKVIDGKEHQISEEEYRAANPEHRGSGCTECSFVDNANTLFVYRIPRELKDRASAEPVYVGKFTMPGWVGHSSFYIFKCEGCRRVLVDYPHGYSAGCLYVVCDDCRSKFIFHPRKNRDVYERDNIHIPPNFNLIELVRLLIRSRREARKLAKNDPV